MSHQIILGKKKIYSNKMWTHCEISISQHELSLTVRYLKEIKIYPTTPKKLSWFYYEISHCLHDIYRHCMVTVRYLLVKDSWSSSDIFLFKCEIYHGHQDISFGQNKILPTPTKSGSLGLIVIMRYIFVLQ